MNIDNSPQRSISIRAVVLFAGIVLAVGAFFFLRWADRVPVAQAVDRALVDARGNDVSTYELHDRDYMLVYFSASWCPPCRKFTPELVDFYERHAESQNFEVILVSADRSQGDMLKYMRSYDMPWPAVAFDDSATRKELQDRYGARGIPNLVLVDSDGEVLSRSYRGGSYVGPQAVLADLREIIDGS